METFAARPSSVTVNVGDKSILGKYRYEVGSEFIGEWNSKRKRHGLGEFLTQDGTLYIGQFYNGSICGLGVLKFADKTRYEGEFLSGWFHGYGIFWSCDGMRYEGQFRGGRIWGYGLATYADGTCGSPGHEGYFQDCRLVKEFRCSKIIKRARKVALLARMQAD